MTPEQRELHQILALALRNLDERRNQPAPAPEVRPCARRQAQHRRVHRTPARSAS